MHHSYGNRTERFQIICRVFCHRDPYKSKSPDPSGVIVKSKGITKGFPRERRHVVKSAQCVSAWQRELPPLSDWQARGVLQRKGRIQTIHVGVLSGFWRVSDEGLVTCWGSHCTLGNGLTTTIKVWKAQRSSAPTFQAVTGWKSLSHVQRHPQKKESVATHVFTCDFIEVSGGWNTQMEHNAGPELQVI